MNDALPLTMTEPGLVGARCLRRVQLLRIGRHPSTDLPVPRGGVMVVSGIGPNGDSNGAGKTTLLSAIALANGDRDWLRGNIGRSAGSLLFDRARAKSRELADASCGYVAGVYCFDDAPASSAITVWMRLSRHSPYVSVRWAEGVHLARGDTEQERITQAEQMWGGMRSETAGASQFAPQLFGNTTRCLAYLRNRGGKDTDGGLLAAGGGMLSETELAETVIDLAGKRALLEDERKLRAELAEERRKLERGRADNQRRWQDEDVELADINSRQRARHALAEAEANWRQYLAAGLVQRLEQQDQLAEQARAAEADLDTTEATLRTLQQRYEQARDTHTLQQRYQRLAAEQHRLQQHQQQLLRKQGSLESDRAKAEQERAGLESEQLGGDADAVDAAAATLAQHEQAQRDAHLAQERARHGVQQAERDRQAIAAGHGGAAGQALAALEHAEIHAAALTDQISLTEIPAVERAQWEARLSLYATTVLVNHAHLGDARSVLDEAGLLAGTALLPVTELPTRGYTVTAAPAGTDPVEELLSALQARMPADDTDSDTVHDHQLGIRIVGGFAVPLTDQAARLDAAAEALVAAREALTAAEQTLETTDADYRTAVSWHNACRAAARDSELAAAIAAVLEQQHEITGQVDELTGQLDEARQAADEAKKHYDSAHEQATELSGQLEQHTSARTRQETQLRKARDEHGQVSGQLAQWQHAFGAHSDTARELLDEAGYRVSVDAEHADARNKIVQTLDLLEVGGDVTQVPSDRAAAALTNTIGGEAVADLRARLAELARWASSKPSPTDSVRPFADVTEAVATWLELYGAEDEARIEAIEQGRREREQAQQAAETQGRSIADWLTAQRQIAIDELNHVFTRTEQQLNTLLADAGRDQVRLRPHYVDLDDKDEPLRWTLSPQWVPVGGSIPIDYRNPPNTAEVLILHTLLAASTLVSGGDPAGRMLIIDESGSNLGSRGVSALASSLRSIATQHGITVILACQDVYAEQVTKHCATSVSLSRPDEHSPLNLLPSIQHGPDTPAVNDLFTSQETP